MVRGAKVFGIGLSKTGTTSLYAALLMLGYRTATFRHMRYLGLSDWISGDFGQDYLSTFDAVTDLPIATYFRELDARYPGSKFILTTRTVDAWLNSIGDQFNKSPTSNSEFGNEVRLAQYGVSTFNEDRFRRLYKEHVAAVRDYFDTRPDDFLEMDVTGGDGWEHICRFLDKPIPDKPFPAVKPYFVPGDRPGFEVSDQPETRNRCFSFVIPVVHPDGKKIGDYNVVERILRETISSLEAQTHDDVNIIVVCHKKPEWADQCGDGVYFLVIGDTPAFAANRNHVQIDKGMKYTIGSVFAIDRLKADKVMLMDGDDFVHRDLANRLSADTAPSAGMDGYLITGGHHALVQPADSGFTIQAVYEVIDFNKTCGSCRVFFASELARHLQRFDPEISKIEPMIPGGHVVDLPDEVIEHVEATSSLEEEQPSSLIRLLGRHVRQNTYFDFAALEEPLAAKGCGHGNHDGRKQGDVHWARIKKLTNGKKFIEEFGLARSPRIQSRPSLKANIRGWLSVFNNQTIKKVVKPN